MKATGLDEAGITNRDRAAAVCLQGILANHEFNRITNADADGRKKAAKLAYEFADALIEASEPNS